MKRLTTLLAGFLLLLAFAPPLAGAAVPGQVNVGLNDVIATVEKSFRQVNGGAPPISDFAANFFQRTVLAKDQRELRAEGQMSVKLPTGSSPLKFRFEYFRPLQQDIISDGAKLWIYHPDNREVILSDVSFLYERMSFAPRDRSINFLEGLDRISRDFQINFAPGMYDSAGNYVLELTPRRAMLNTRRMLLVVNRESVMAYVRGATPLSTPGSVPSTRLQSAAPQPRDPFGSLPAFGGTKSDTFPILSTTVYDHEGNTVTMELLNVQVNGRIPDFVFNFIIPGGVQIVRPSEQNIPR